MCYYFDEITENVFMDSNCKCIFGGFLLFAFVLMNY